MVSVNQYIVSRIKCCFTVKFNMFVKRLFRLGCFVVLFTFHGISVFTLFLKLMQLKSKYFYTNLLSRYEPAYHAYLSKPIDWYLTENCERQSGIGNQHCGPVAYTIDQLLKRNKNREYKGAHTFCAAEELIPPRIIICVIYKLYSLLLKRLTQNTHIIRC